MKIIRQASLEAKPWKNGGGTTREAIRVPPTGDPCQWRVSIAEIDRSGPFSDFTGYERFMVLLQGEGVSLQFPDGEEALLQSVGECIQFDGAAAVNCRLLNGPCLDLNLMVAQATHKVDVQVEPLDTPLILEPKRGEWLVIFAIAGAVAIENAAVEPTLLDTWDLAVVSAADGSITKLVAAHEQAAWVFVARLSKET